MTPEIPQISLVVFGVSHPYFSLVTHSLSLWADRSLKGSSHSIKVAFDGVGWHLVWFGFGMHTGEVPCFSEFDMPLFRYQISCMSVRFECLGS